MTSIANLASIYHVQGQWNKAEKLDMKMIEIRKKILDPEHSFTLTSMFNLTITY